MPRTFDFEPTVRNISNVFDYFGMLIGLPRIKGEKNAEYRKRLWEVYVCRASSTQQGLINGITRELGMKQYDAITVTYSGPTTNSPRVLIRDVQIELYSNWNLIDDTISLNILDGNPIDIYTRDADGYYLGGLIEEINNSTYFTASLENGVSEKALSTCLLEQDSRQWQEAEALKPFYINTLEYRNVIPGTLTFSRSGMDIFNLQKESVDQVLLYGDYHVDYSSGVITSYAPPSEDVVCRYMYDQLPMTFTASPVILHEFGSSYFRTKVFEQILQSDGTYIDGLPLDTAIKYINELMNVRGVLWG